MTQKDIALYYEQLTRGEKGRFTAFIGICGMILFPMNSFCYD